MYYEVQSLIINVIKEKRFVWIYSRLRLNVFQFCCRCFRNDCEQTLVHDVFSFASCSDNNKKKYY